MCSAQVCVPEEAGAPVARGLLRPIHRYWESRGNRLLLWNYEPRFSPPGGRRDPRARPPGGGDILQYAVAEPIVEVPAAATRRNGCHL